MSKHRNDYRTWKEWVEDRSVFDPDKAQPPNNWWYSRGYAYGSNDGFWLGVLVAAVVFVAIWLLF